MSSGRSRDAIPVAHSDLSLWPAPDIAIFTSEIRAKFESRRESLIMYAAGDSYETICLKCGFKKGEILRLIKRCLTINQTGGIYGFYALIPGFRVQAYTRTADFRGGAGGRGGFAGALTATFMRFPELELEIQSACLDVRGSHAAMKNQSFDFSAIHRLFKRRLSELGVTSLEWPFNQKNHGSVSLRKYCKKILHGRAGGSGRGKAALGRHAIGRGVSALIRARTPFTIVQLDYHKVDAASTISIENEFGEEKDIVVQRWHIGLLADERLSGIIGLHVALEATPSADDALETIASAIIGDANRSNVGSRSSAPGNKLFLVRHFLPELDWQCFAAMKMDNGWANLASDTVDNLISVVGCAVNFGPVYSWWRRHLIENIIGKLTSKGLQRTAFTHGSGPNDPRVSNPNEEAVKFKIKISDLESIIWSCIREYNNSENEHNQFTAPVKALSLALQQKGLPFLPQPLPNEERRGERILYHVQEVTVRGNLEKNERPYFKLDRVRHTNEKLSEMYGLIGKKLISYTNRRLCREVQATIKETGESLGFMHPGQGWEFSNASWRDRKYFNRTGLSKRSQSDHTDLMEEFVEEKASELIEKQSRKRQKAASDALRLARMHTNIQRNSNADASPISKNGTTDVPNPESNHGLNKGVESEVAGVTKKDIVRKSNEHSKPASYPQEDPFGLFGPLVIKPHTRNG